MKSSNIKRNMGRLTNSACALLFAGTVFVSCQDELLTGMPSWLGSSIYEELQERGEFGTTLRLINDPVFEQEGLPTMLSLTGSKTLFVAKDDAYARFFQSNPWGVRKYEDLSEAQKKLLLRTSLVDNALLLELMANTGTDDKEAGQSLRRATSLTLYDSVQVLPLAEMPQNVYWDKYRYKDMLVMRDATVPLISYYLPGFMSKMQFTNDDVRFLTNGAYADNNAAYVSGHKVVEQDVTCQNGYIQVLDGVLQPLTSMAEMISYNPKYTVMKSFLDRFSFPEYNESASREYNRLYNNGASTDSVFTWRYLNNGFNAYRTSGDDHRAVRIVNNDNSTAKAWTDILPYDPGWNRYDAGNNDNSLLYKDMAVFVVPTDEAFEHYRNDGATGTSLYNAYGSWDNIPDNIVAKLLQNLMMTSLTTTVPSKFGSVLNTAQRPFFSSQADVDAITACHLASNGVIFESNKVFSAPDYISVSFPVMLDDNMKVTYKAITDLQLNAYLNSLDSKYTFLPPTDKALEYYLDPVDIHKTSDRQTYARFYMGDDGNIKCERFYMDGTRVTGAALSDANYIKNRMNDILNNSIIVGDVEDSLRMGYYVFSSKGGAPVVFEPRKMEENIRVKGAGQLERDEDYIPVRDGGYSNMTRSDGNGITCILDEQPVMPATKSVLTVLAELKDSDAEHYGEFYDMLNASTLVSELYDNGKTMSNGKTILAMDNYQYTIYSPTSASIKELYAAGVLPDYRSIKDDENGGPTANEKIWEEFKDEWTKDNPNDRNKSWSDFNKDEQDSLEIDFIEPVIEQRQGQINSFLRYHIQNSAMYLGSNIQNVMYETTLMSPEGRFYSLSIIPGSAPGDRFSVRSNGFDGNAVSGVPVRHVLNTENHYAREYHFRNANGSTFNNINNAETIYNSSFAVVHSIDGPLLYNAAMVPGSNAVNKSSKIKR